MAESNESEQNGRVKAATTAEQLKHVNEGQAELKQDVKDLVKVIGELRNDFTRLETQFDDFLWLKKAALGYGLGLLMTALLALAAVLQHLRIAP